MRGTGPVQLISTATCPSIQEREQIRSRVDWSIYSHFQLVPLKSTCPNSTQSFPFLTHFHISVHFILFIPFVIVFPLPAALAPALAFFPFPRGIPWRSPRLSQSFASSIPPTPRRDSLPFTISQSGPAAPITRLHDLCRLAIP